MSGSAHDALFRGHACFVDEEYTEALKHYATAIEHAPGDADAYSKRAAAHLKLNNNTEAVADQVADASRPPETTNFSKREPKRNINTL